jgi:hypothetical protein
MRCGTRLIRFFALCRSHPVIDGHIREVAAALSCEALILDGAHIQACGAECPIIIGCDDHPQDLRTIPNFLLQSTQSGLVAAVLCIVEHGC